MTAVKKTWKTRRDRCFRVDWPQMEEYTENADPRTFRDLTTLAMGKSVE